MTTVHADFSRIKGPIKPMHGIGQPPMIGAETDLFHYLEEAHIPYSRLHDVQWPYSAGVFVDIPNIFRNFDADVNDPASYDFAFTDHLLLSLDKAGVKPVYRLGVTIENYFAIKAYRIDPPKDYHKWAEICEHIIAHYNEGWADGYHLGIVYWEIWNEPDGAPQADHRNAMWTGTEEQYYELYHVAASHLKAVFGDRIKVGGYASCGFYRLLEYDENGKPYDYVTDEWRHRCGYYIDFFKGFIDYVKPRHTPFDFFSWHSYEWPEATGKMTDMVRKFLDDAGYPDTETMIDEWNPDTLPSTRGTPMAAADAAAMMLIEQDKPVEMLCYYDGSISAINYGGLFNPISHMPFTTYYSFKAFGELYVLGKECLLEISGKGVYGVAASDGTPDGKRALMLSNIADGDREITTDLPQGFSAYLISGGHSLEKVLFDAKRFMLRRYDVVLLANYEVK